MAENFLHAKLKDKIKAELPELLKYYKEHMRDPEFDRPAQIIWREIVVETRPAAPPASEARRKIEAIRQRAAATAPISPRSPGPRARARRARASRAD